MRYISTRGKADSRSFKEILLEGLAPDGGLYMPERYPVLSDAELAALRGCSYKMVAWKILSLFCDDISPGKLAGIVRKTYTAETFGDKNITPLWMLEPGLGLLQLSNGPTLAFKDVPLQLLGNLMEYALEEKGDDLNILGATSGDTGSAAEYAVRGKDRMNIFMLSPYGRMSRFQQRQMYTLNEPNIFNLVVNGDFDACQAVVKEVNADLEFKKKFKIGAVNSINWARVAAQAAYYFYGYLQATTANTQRVTFAVPSGNFGNALAAYIAQRMGLPIDIIVATNENDVLDEFFRTEIYRVRKGSEVKATSSPSMDIASASNFERLIFDLAGGDAGIVRDLWTDLKEKGQFDARFLLPSMNSGIRSGMATEAEVLQAIRSIYNKYEIIIDPHTAVGMHVGLQYRKAGTPLIVAETAQAAKFADTIREALGFEAPVPRSYGYLEHMPEHMTRIDPDARVVKDFIAAHVK